MDTTTGSAIDQLRKNQTIMEGLIAELKDNTTDYEGPTIQELNRLSEQLEKPQSFDQVGVHNLISLPFSNHPNVSS